jgi:hypothetical protein
VADGVNGPLSGHPLRSLLTAPKARSRRSSTWDRTGGNRDGGVLQPRETVVLLDEDGPGCVTKIYMATGPFAIDWMRDLVLRCWWDGEPEPSVEVPLGDFFCVSHGRLRPVQSFFVSVTQGLGWSWGLTATFPMPFDAARITLENRGPFTGYLHHIEYELYDEPVGADVLRFHAQWRHERPTTPVGTAPFDTALWNEVDVNLDGADNYVALDAVGAGQMVGLHLQIDNLAGGWYGEGDDMVFLDGDTWPPSIHGTGTEEVFGAGACPNRAFSGPWTGMHLVESPTYEGLHGMHRWYVADPIRFARSIRWTIEHGHANNYASDYTSVAYWYQTEPHAPFPPLPARDAMLPPHGEGYDEATAEVLGWQRSEFRALVRRSARARGGRALRAPHRGGPLLRGRLPGCSRGRAQAARRASRARVIGLAAARATHPELTVEDQVLQR